MTWEELGYANYADYINGQNLQSFANDYHVASQLIKNSACRWPREGSIEFVCCTNYWSGHSRDFKVRIGEQEYRVSVFAGPYDQIGPRHIIGLLYQFTGRRLASIRQMEQAFSEHYRNAAWAVAKATDKMALALDGGTSNSKYFVLRDVIKRLPKRQRCTVCGKVYSRWEHSYLSHHVCSDSCDLISQDISMKQWRRERAAQLKQRRFRKQWKNGIQIYKDLKRLLKSGKVPEACQSQSRESRQE